VFVKKIFLHYIGFEKKTGSKMASGGLFCVVSQQNSMISTKIRSKYFSNFFKKPYSAELGLTANRIAGEIGMASPQRHPGKSGTLAACT